MHDFFEKLPFVIRKLVNIKKGENRLYINQSQVYCLLKEITIVRLTIKSFIGDAFLPTGGEISSRFDIRTKVI